MSEVTPLESALLLQCKLNYLKQITTRATGAVFKDFTVKYSTHKLEWEQKQRHYWKQSSLALQSASRRALGFFCLPALILLSLIHLLLFVFPVFWTVLVLMKKHSRAYDFHNKCIHCDSLLRPRMGIWMLRHRWFKDLQWRAIVVVFCMVVVWFFFNLILNQRGGIWSACDEESVTPELVTLGPLACRPHELVVL